MQTVASYGAPRNVRVGADIAIEYTHPQVDVAQTESSTSAAKIVISPKASTFIAIEL